MKFIWKEKIYNGDKKMVLSKLKEKLEGRNKKGDKKMKVAILGAGCYRTHAASGITNFARACEEELVKLQKQQEKKTFQ